MMTRDITLVILIKYYCTVLKSAIPPCSVFNKAEDSRWIDELSNGFCYCQPLVWVGIHLVIEIFEFKQICT